MVICYLIMNLIKEIDLNKKKFDLEVLNFLKNNLNSDNLDQAIKYSVTNGGKRIRPYLVNKICKLLKIKKSHQIAISIAAELVHTYSLVHDDLPVMDNDDIRRGKPTTHKKFNEAVAILAGNSIFTLAIEILSKTNFKKDIKKQIKIIKLLCDIAGIKGLAKGQSLDLEIPNNNFQRKKILEIYELKTSKLFEFCIVSPFVLANKKNNDIESARLYSKNLGLIFQITDDLLDANSTSKKVGKKTNKDIIKNHLMSKISQKKAIEICNNLIIECTNKNNFFGKRNPFFKNFLNYLLGRTY